MLMYVAAILLSFLVSFAQASEVINTHNNVRALGMGGIWMSVVTDHDALFVNPAALTKIKGLDWQVLNAEFGVNGVDTYNDVRGIDSSDPNSYSALFGKQVWLRAGARSSIALPNFGVGIYNESNTNLELHNPAFPQFETHFVSDTGIVLGGAFNVAPGISGGLALKQISRWGGDKDIDLGTLANGDLGNIGDQFQNKGRGYGVDLALMSEMPGPIGPRFSVVWQDVGSTAFTKTSGTDAPPRIHDNLSLGVSTGLDLPGLDLTAGLEYNHATESEYQFGQKVHFGAEISLPLIDLRGGISQGYAAYGLGFNILFLRFDVAKYTEEMGAYPGQTPQDRLQAGISIELGFDADFRLTDSEGRKRKLKQRR
jgi:hypothetical protein